MPTGSNAFWPFIGGGLGKGTSVDVEEELDEGAVGAGLLDAAELVIEDGGGWLAVVEGRMGRGIDMVMEIPTLREAGAAGRVVRGNWDVRPKSRPSVPFGYA